jgi:hypothetical protein
MNQDTRWVVLSFHEGFIAMRKLFVDSREALAYTQYLRKTEAHWEHDYQVVEYA